MLPRYCSDLHPMISSIKKYNRYKYIYLIIYMRNQAESILEFISNKEVPKKAREVVDHMELDQSDRNEVLSFYKKRMVELYEMGLDYSLKEFDIELQDQEMEDINNEVQTQLIYWWLEIQSEWIRYNNMLNFKSAMLGESDKVLQAKASICSFFLNPVGELLDKDIINKNMEYLAGLVERSKFGTAENTD